MARVRLVIAVVLAASALAALAGPAGASVPAANAKFCKAAAKIGSGTDTSGKPTKEQASAALKGFKNAEKYASGKVKSAMKNIAKYLQRIADAENAGDIAKIYTSSDFKGYTKSIGTFIGALASCSTTATT